MMKIMEFDISSLDAAAIVAGLSEVPESTKSSQRDSLVPFTRDEALQLLQEADPDRSGIICLNVAEKPSKQKKSAKLASFKPSKRARNWDNRASANPTGANAIDDFNRSLPMDQPGTDNPYNSNNYPNLISPETAQPHHYVAHESPYLSNAQPPPHQANNVPDVDGNRAPPSSHEDNNFNMIPPSASPRGTGRRRQQHEGDTRSRRADKGKSSNDAKHLYILLKGHWRTQRSGASHNDQFQGVRLQFRSNRQGESFFKYHAPEAARDILLGKHNAIELIDHLTEEDIEGFEQYADLLRQADYIAVGFVRLLLTPYFNSEKPVTRKIKTNRFLGMRKQNTFYTKPTQSGVNLNTLTQLKTPFLNQLRNAIRKRVESLEFYQECNKAGSECYRRLQCSYQALGADPLSLEEDLDNKSHYMTHSDPAPELPEEEVEENAKNENAED